MLSRIFDYISNLEIVQHQSSITPDCSVGVLCAEEELKTRPRSWIAYAVCSSRPAVTDLRQLTYGN